MKRRSKVRLRHVLSFIGLIGLACIILLNHHQFTSFWHLIGQLRWYVIVLTVLVQLSSYYINARYYRSILRIFSYNVSLVRLFEGALAANFVNYVVPAAGLAGAGYLSQVLSPEVPRGEGVLTQLTRYGLSAVAVLIMMPVGFLLIFLSHDIHDTIIRVTLLSALGIVVLAGAIVMLIEHETTLRRVVEWCLNFIKRFRPNFAAETPIEHFIDEFYVGYNAITAKKQRLIAPIAWSVVYIVIEILTFYMAFLSFGKVINPGVAVMAYLFANIASIFGGVIVSTGVFELGMSGTLVALGVPFAEALPVTIVYRVLNLVIGLPPGYYYYRRYLNT